MDKKYFLTGVCLFFLCISSPLSRGATLPYRQQINLIDSMTGYAVSPDNMVIKDTTRGLIIYQEGGEQGKKESTKGTIPVSLTYGSYDYVFEAAGYHSMAANFTVNNKSPRIINVYLDPLETPTELNPEFIASLHRPDATVIIGFVVDDNTGMPIADVQIGENGGNSCPKTNDSGFFILNIPFPPHGEGIPVAEISFQKEGYRTELRKYVELMPDTDWIYRVHLKRGKGKKVIDERAYRRRDIKEGFKEDGYMQDENEALQNTEGDTQQKTFRETQETPLITIPHTIRVGKNCSNSTSCSSVAVYSLDTYVKYVLPAEWYSCWGALANGMNSLKAGAVAIRSYGVYYVRNPIDVYHYDICDKTSCQVVGNVQSTVANNAVDQTSGYVLANDSNTVIKSEYAAENNNRGCGDCYTGTCIYDPVCCGATNNGHGRGLCQYGSIRWATDTFITTKAPCTSGAFLGYGNKDWMAILKHYYQDYQLVQGTALQTGDRVIAITKLNIREQPCVTCTVQCTALSGNTGMVIDGPEQGDNFSWWHINWDDGTGNCTNGTAGWSVENFLAKAEETTPNCEARKITAFPGRLILKKREGREVVVTITGTDACPVEGETVQATMGKSGKNYVKVLPKSNQTGSNGQAIFTVNAKNRTGRTKITFKAGDLKKTLSVKVKK